MKWVEVTRDNFAAQLPGIYKALEGAQFVAFDTELTGLCTGRHNRYSVLDDAQGRYAKLRDSASNFGLLQVGLSAFHWNDHKSKFVPSTFVFYVFPSRTSSANNERRFTCQLSSLSFLADYDFDFNKTFRKGIPFTSRREEELLREQRAAAVDERPLISMQGDDKVLVEQQCARIGKWLEEGAAEPLDLPPCNAYQRLLFYQQIHRRFEGVVVGKRDSRKDAVLVLTRPTAAERRTQLEDEGTEFERGLRESAGFRQVIDYLVEQKIPMVGHNCALDLCHFYQKFVGPMPPLWTDLKGRLHELFPVILDTKYLAKTLLPNLSDNGLSDLAAHFKGNQGIPLVHPPNESKEAFHDAGYDSFCTGMVFLGIVHEGARDKTPFCERVAAMLRGPNANKLNVMQSDYPCFSLDACDAVPDRSRVLYLGSASLQEEDMLLCDFTTTAIQDAYSRHVPSASVQVLWNNASSAFLIVDDVEHAQAVVGNPEFMRPFPEGFVLLRYEDYAAQRSSQAGGGGGAGSKRRHVRHDQQ